MSERAEHQLRTTKVDRLKRSVAAWEIQRISLRATADAINIRCRRICNPSSLRPRTANNRPQQEQAAAAVAAAASGVDVLTVRGRICHRYDTSTKCPIKTSQTGAALRIPYINNLTQANISRCFHLRPWSLSTIMLLWHSFLIIIIIIIIYRSAT